MKMETDIDFELEEGEIKDDVDVSCQARVVSEDDESSSSTDSDDSQKRFKPKLRKLSHPPRPKRNTIWCTDLLEDTLTSTLVNNCTFDNIDRSRDVEHYNYLLALPHVSEVKKILRRGEGPNPNRGCRSKRSRGGCFVSDRTTEMGQKPKSNKRKILPSRELLPLVKTVENTEEELAQDIANKLYEEKEDLILRAITLMGKEAIIGLFDDVRNIEESGGLMTANEDRRRTPGGVFFYLLKCSARLKPGLVTKIFYEDRQQEVKKKRKSAYVARMARQAERKKMIQSEDYPTLLSKAEAAVRKLKEEQQREAEDGVEDGGVKNPPPSPATDGKDYSSEGEEVAKADMYQLVNNV